MARIGVIIVNYNSGELLRSCLASVFRQSRSADSVVVIDNASHDESRDVALEFPGVKLIRHTQNTGFAAAANTGIETCDGCDWVALLNPDAFASTGWLEEVDRAISERPGFGSYACRMMSHEEPDIVDGAGDAYHISGRPRRISHGSPLAQSDLVEREVFSPCAGAGVYKREAVLQAGGFDEDFFCYLEDIDLGFRLQLMRQKCLYIPGAVVEHIGSAISGRGSDFQIYHAHRNIVWSFCKNMPLLVLVPALPLHLLLNLWTLVMFAARGSLLPVLRAKRDAIKGLPGMLRKRQAIRSSRRAGTVELLKVISFTLQ